MSEIKNELDTLPVRALLAAAFITYLSAASEDRRRQCLDSWMAHSGLQSKYITSSFTTLATAYGKSCPKQPTQTPLPTHNITDSTVTTWNIQMLQLQGLLEELVCHLTK